MCVNDGHPCPKVAHIFKNCRFYQCVSNMLRQSPVSFYKPQKLKASIHLLCNQFCQLPTEHRNKRKQQRYCHFFQV